MGEKQIWEGRNNGERVAVQCKHLFKPAERWDGFKEKD